MNKVIAKKGDIVVYNNLTFQNTNFGVVVSRNEEDNGYEVVRLNGKGQPFIMTLPKGVHFDQAFDSNVVKVYEDGLDENGNKLF